MFLALLLKNLSNVKREEKEIRKGFFFLRRRRGNPVPFRFPSLLSFFPSSLLRAKNKRFHFQNQKEKSKFPYLFSKFQQS